jgi:uncharacterized protein involved in exopolysaccharide biosynthesis
MSAAQDRSSGSGSNSELGETSRELESELDATLPDEPGNAGAFLLTLAGEHPGRVFPLNRPERIIGRGAEADVRIDQPSISHRHAKIVAVGGRHRLVDLDSRNGTYVNDRQVIGEVDLLGGDVIRIGETTLSYLRPRGEGGDLPTVAMEHVPVELYGFRSPQGVSARAFPPHAPRPDIEVRPMDAGASLHDALSKAIQVWRFFARHRAVFVVITVCAGALGALSAFVFPPAASAEFQLRLTPKTAENPFQQNERNDEAPIEFLASAESNFTSPDLVRETLIGMGDKDPSSEAVGQARDRLHFDSVAHLTYKGTYSDRTPDRALEFLSRHVRNYLGAEIEKTLKVARAEVDFLKGQLDENEAELARTETALRDFKQKHENGLPDQGKEQFTQLGSLENRASQLASIVDRTTMELALAKKKLAEADAMLSQKVLASRPYQEAMVEVQRKLGEARAHGLGEAHPDVQRLRAQSAELERLSRQAILRDASDVERGADPGLKAARDRVAELEVTKASAERELASVSGQAASISKILRAMPDVEAKFAELSRSYDGIKEIHGRLFERYKASQLQLELERATAAARYEIITPPQVHKTSLRKTLALRVFIGGVFGFVLGGAVALALELRRYLRENAF